MGPDETEHMAGHARLGASARTLASRLSVCLTATIVLACGSRDTPGATSTSGDTVDSDSSVDAVDSSSAETVAADSSVGAASSSSAETVAADSSVDAASSSSGDTTAAKVRRDDGVTHTMMRNVYFHLPSDVVLRIRYAQGEMRPLRDDQPITFDDIHSFAVRIDAGEVALSMESLERLMNDWVFAYDDAPLRDFSFETTGEHIVLSGKLDALIDLSFEVEASAEITSSGEILMRPHRLRTGGTIGTALRKLLGLELDEVIDFSGARGVRADGNDLYLDPAILLPPPLIEGPITEIRVESGLLVQRFGNAKANRTARADIDRALGKGTNEMRFTGGTLAFGKMRMIDADMGVIDLDPADPFSFSIVAYHDQLVAGFSRTMPDDGLDVYMPDLDNPDGTHRRK